MPTKLFILCAGVGLLWASQSPADEPDFEREIAPILVNHCLDCHQPTKHSGELNLATLAGALKGGELGPALTPGKPAESLLLERLKAGEMPPPDAKEAKPLSASQIETLRAWIAAGANWPKDRELGIHERAVDLDQAREFWSFQPVKRPAIRAGAILPSPLAGEGLGVRGGNPIDAFILDRLSAAGLTLSPPAAPHDLLRRLSLDLRGLPPSLEEQAEFDADGTRSAPATLAPDAHERLVDRMLADPAYGERWARHWLDLVRYADSNGYERDGPKPSVWKYRDYVIAALNGDKPYDRFVLEQIAGDELPGASHEALIATGFHALGAWQDEVDPLEAAQYRADELDDMIRTTSQTFLGLTLGCARCHNHKFDPLTMVDYYSLAAILAPLKRPNLSRFDRDLPLGTPEQIAAEAKRDAAIAELEKQVGEMQKAKPADLEQQVAALREQQKHLRLMTPDLPRAYRCYEDTPDPPPTYLLLSGRASNPGPLMQPRVPAVLTVNRRDHAALEERGVSTAAKSAVSTSTGRRLMLARWLANEENPLTARVIVNRMWQHHFGDGLVATPSDFGQMGARPTHPELLDLLAHWFVHDADWSLKKLHRLIVTSETYRQESQILDFGLPILDSRTDADISSNPKSKIQNPKLIDPDNKLLWHFPYRRLDVEAIRDSMLAVSGNLNQQMYGPAVFLPIPEAAIEAHTDKQAAWKVSKEPDIDRRTVYAYVKRTLLVPMMETLDFCDTTNSTEKRAITSVAPQALTLFNGDFVNRQAEHFARRLKREAGDDSAKQIDLAFRLALCRQPTADETTAMQLFLDRETATTDRQRALVQLCRVILNLNEFVYPN